MSFCKKIGFWLAFVGLCLPVIAQENPAAFTKHDTLMVGVQIAALAIHCTGLYSMSRGACHAYTTGVDKDTLGKILTGLFFYLGSGIVFAKTCPGVNGIAKLLKAPPYCDTWSDTLRYIFDEERQ